MAIEVALSFTVDVNAGLHDEVARPRLAVGGPGSGMVYVVPDSYILKMAGWGGSRNVTYVSALVTLPTGETMRTWLLSGESPDQHVFGLVKLMSLDQENYRQVIVERVDNH